MQYVINSHPTQMDNETPVRQEAFGACGGVTSKRADRRKWYGTRCGNRAHVRGGGGGTRPARVQERERERERGGGGGRKAHAREGERHAREGERRGTRPTREKEQEGAYGPRERERVGSEPTVPHRHQKGQCDREKDVKE